MASPFEITDDNIRVCSSGRHALFYAWRHLAALAGSAPWLCFGCVGGPGHKFQIPSRSLTPVPYNL